MPLTNGRPDPRDDFVFAAVTEVRRIYAELAKRPVERQCIRRTECCQFKLTGLTPYLTKGEALVAARAWRATGRTRLSSTTDGACPMLEPGSGRCLIYADRPFGCRTHFCAAAGGPYARREVADLIHRLEAIDHSLGGDGASALPHALRSALAQLQ
jgi:Fe-S-cluster containining protein